MPRYSCVFASMTHHVYPDLASLLSVGPVVSSHASPVADLGSLSEDTSLWARLPVG